MRFRRDELIIIESAIAFAIPIACNIFLLIRVKPFAPLLLIMLLLTLVCFIFNCIAFSSPHIEVTAQGIACLQKQNILWTYQWEEIKALRIGSHFRLPSIEFEFATTDRKEQRKIEEAKPYFQYGRSAKKALARYCPYPITKITSKAPFHRFPKQ